MSNQSQHVRTTSILPRMHHGVLIFGRREHYELISRIWFTRDVRPMHTFQFQERIVQKIRVNWLNPQISTVCTIVHPDSAHDEIESKARPLGTSIAGPNPTTDNNDGGLNIINNCDRKDGRNHRTQLNSTLIDTKIPHLNNDRVWWDQKATDDLYRLHESAEENCPLTEASLRAQKAQCPWKHLYFWDSSLQLTFPRSLNAEHWMVNLLEENDQQQELKYGNDTEKGEEEDVTLIPFFNQGQGIETQQNSNAFFYKHFLSCHLSLHHIVPTRPTENISAFSARLVIGLAYEPTFRLVHRLIVNTLSTLTHVPFIIIPIDLCDDLSLNIAVWAYHLLLYLHNSACVFPTKEMTVLIMFFNEMGLDHPLATPQQIHGWFENFPFHCQFVSYPSFFPLPEFVELDSNCRTISTLSLPADIQTPETLNIRDISPPNNENHHCAEEQANIELASTLDRLWISQMQTHYLKEFVNEVGWFSFDSYSSRYHPFAEEQVSQGHQKNRPRLLCPVAPSLRYPFQSLIGKPIISSKKSNPIIMPDQSPHWCLFDKCYQKRILPYLPKAQNRHSTIFDKPENDESGTEQNQTNSYNLHKYGPHETTHICSTLHIQFLHPYAFNPTSFEIFPQLPISPDSPNDPWGLDLVIDTIGTSHFDFVALPFSIRSNFDPQFPPPNAPPTTINLIKQHYNYVDQHLESRCASERELAPIGALTIDHYSTPSIHPVLRFPTTYSLGSDGRMQILQNTPILENSTKPQSDPQDLQASISTTTTTATWTTLLRSHNFPDRYYSTMRIDEDAQDLLTIERPSLLKLGLESSQLVSLHPIDTSTKITQHWESADAENGQTLEVNPLSSQPHHFYLQMHDTSHHPTPMMAHRLFSFSILNLSTLLKEIDILTRFRSLIFQSTWRTLIHSYFKLTPNAQLRFSNPLYFTTAYELHTTSRLRLNQAHNQRADGQNKHYTITSCTVDIPSKDQLQKFDFATLHEFFQSGYRFSSGPYWAPHNSRDEQDNITPSQNRNLIPHFILVVDDLNNDDINNVRNDSNRTKLPCHSDLMTSYLSSHIPKACSSFDGDVALHYSFTTRDRLKTTMNECIQTAIAIRLDHYESFNPVYSGE